MTCRIRRRHGGSRVQVVGSPCLFIIFSNLLGHEIGLSKRSLTGGRPLCCRYGLIGIPDILGDNVAHLIFALSEYFAHVADETVGRTVLIFLLIVNRLVLVGFQVYLAAVGVELGRVPGIPLRGVVHLVCQDITRVVTHVVRLAEHEIEGLVNGLAIVVFDHHVIAVLVFRCLHDGFHLLVVDGLCRSSIPQRLIFVGQHHVARWIECVADLAAVVGDVCLFHEQLFLRVTQQVPVPIADGCVLVIVDVVDVHLLAKFQWHARRSVVRIAVGHDVHQFHAAVRGSGDGQRYLHGLAVGIRRTGVGRYILVVDIDLSLDVPVVGRHGIVALILTADVVAVVDDGLRAVYEVARGLPLVQP